MAMMVWEDPIDSCDDHALAGNLTKFTSYNLWKGRTCPYSNIFILGYLRLSGIEPVPAATFFLPLGYWAILTTNVGMYIHKFYILFNKDLWVYANANFRKI